MEINKKLISEIKSESWVSSKVTCIEIEGKGKGLIATETIRRNEIVSISGGIIISTDYWETLKDLNLDYSYFVAEGFLICPLNPEDPSDDWRMNHCCQPNCGIKGQIVFVALRDIFAGEELTFDYAMSESDSTYSMPLSCDKENCRKRFTEDDWKRRDIQEKYKGYFSMYLQDKIDKINNQRIVYD
jgi:hypothetical protein